MPRKASASNAIDFAWIHDIAQDVPDYFSCAVRNGG